MIQFSGELEKSLDVWASELRVTKTRLARIIIERAILISPIDAVRESYPHESPVLNIIERTDETVVVDDVLQDTEPPQAPVLPPEPAPAPATPESKPEPPKFKGRRAVVIPRARSAPD